VSKSSIVAAALASWLSSDAGDQREAATAKRLDRLSRQFERLERDQNILIETMALRERQNILIAGGTNTGKTTLANALLAEIAATGDRVLVLEDTVELQCAARDHVSLRTRANVVSMAELVRATMRLRPDRVIVGEVRGGEPMLTAA
jgi:Flp pilus assembly CpaF family ATPase